MAEWERWNRICPNFYRPSEKDVAEFCYGGDDDWEMPTRA